MRVIKDGILLLPFVWSKTSVGVCSSSAFSRAFYQVLLSFYTSKQINTLIFPFGHLVENIAITGLRNCAVLCSLKEIVLSAGVGQSFLTTDYSSTLANIHKEFFYVGSRMEKNWICFAKNVSCIAQCYCR